VGILASSSSSKALKRAIYFIVEWLRPSLLGDGIE
jgi:hypothetical protein